MIFKSYNLDITKFVYNSIKSDFDLVVDYIYV